MKTIMVSRCCLHLILPSMFCCVFGPPAQSAPDPYALRHKKIDRFIYQVRAQRCRFGPDRAQTGFRVAGTKGIVTALHGVADSDRITAISRLGRNAPGKLRIAAVDIKRDLALLTSEKTEKWPDEGLAPANFAEPIEEPLSIFCHALGIDERVVDELLFLRGREEVGLRSAVDPEFRLLLSDRKSPAPGLPIFWIRGYVLPAASGGPVLDSKDRLIAVGNGGIRGSDLSWAIPYRNLNWVDPDTIEFRDLQNRDPRPLFNLTSMPVSLARNTGAASDVGFRWRMDDLLPETSSEPETTPASGDREGPNGKLKQVVQSISRAGRVYYDQGVTYLRSNDLDKAATAFGRATSVDQKSAYPWCGSGVVYLKRQQYGMAVRSFGKAIECSPRSPEAQCGMGVSLMLMGDNARAEKFLSYSLSLSNRVKSSVNYSAYLITNGRATEAIKLLRKAVEKDNKNPDALNNLGNALQMEGQYEEAMRLHREAFKADPRFAGAHDNLGNDLEKLSSTVSDQARRMELLDESIREHREAIRLDTRRASYRSNLAVALFKRGDHDGAIESYRDALDVDPYDPKAHFNLADTLKIKGEYVDSELHYILAIDANPSYAPAHNDYGDLLSILDRIDEAIDCFEEAKRLSPKYTFPYNNLADMWRKKGMYEKAEAGYREAIRRFPDYDSAYDNLGKMYMFLGRYGDAVAPLREAVRISPRTVNTLYNLACAESLTGKIDEALVSLRRAIELDINLKVKAQSDQDLDALRDLDEFKKLLK